MTQAQSMPLNVCERLVEAAEDWLEKNAPWFQGAPA